MGTTSLVCSCGLRLKAAGARPGRVGKCPKCGALLRVAEGPTDPGPTAPPRPARGVDPGSTDASPPSFHASPTLSAASPTYQRPGRFAADHGPVSPPRRLDAHLGQSLLYPLWGWSSVALLAFGPPLLVVFGAPLPFLVGILSGNTPFKVAGLVLVGPLGLGGIFVLGYVLIFLGNVLTSSAFGERLPPRTPSLLDDDVFRVLGRWFWAIVLGFLVGFLPAVLYWIYCGEVDWIDRLMFVNLAALGVSYAQMALLACLLHDDPLAANPVTVIRAIVRVGWDYAGPCFLGGGFVAGMAALLVVATRGAESPAFPALMWLFYLASLYGSMVVLRRLGLFCHRHKVVLAWFPDRPTWGR